MWAEQQGEWTRGESMELRKVTWSDIFHRVWFLVQAVYGALPSPANLHAWWKSEKRRGENISSMAAQRPWLMVATAGAVTRYLKLLFGV